MFGNHLIIIGCIFTTKSKKIHSGLKLDKYHYDKNQPNISQCGVVLIVSLSEKFRVTLCMSRLEMLSELIGNAVCGAVCEPTRNAVCGAVCEPIRNAVCDAVCESIENAVCYIHTDRYDF